MYNTRYYSYMEPLRSLLKVFCSRSSSVSTSVGGRGMHANELELLFARIAMTYP